MAKTSGGVRNNKPKSVAQRAKEKIITVLSDIRRQGFSRISPFKIGSVEKRMSDFAKENGIELGSRDVYMTSAAIAHAKRDSKKGKDLAVSDSELSSFPSRLKRMDLYYDTRNGNFIYTNGDTKYVVHPNYEMKISREKKKVVNFVTASRVTDKNEFNMKEYKKIR